MWRLMTAGWPAASTHSAIFLHPLRQQSSKNNWNGCSNGSAHDPRVLTDIWRENDELGWQRRSIPFCPRRSKLLRIVGRELTCPCMSGHMMICSDSNGPRVLGTGTEREYDVRIPRQRRAADSELSECSEAHTVMNGKTERMLLPGYYIVERRRDDDLVYTM